MSNLQKIKDKFDAKLARHGTLGAALVKGVAGTATMKAARFLIVFASSVVLARALGPAGLGVVSFVIVLAQLLSTPSELGVPNLAVREIAVTNVRKDWGHMRGFIRWANGVIGVVALTVAVGGAIWLLVWGHKVDPVRLSCIWLGLLLVPLTSLNALRGSMLRGLRKVLLGQLPEQVIRPFVFLVLILFMTYLGDGLRSPQAALGAHIVSVAVAFACGMALFLRNRPPELSRAEPRYNARAWFYSSIPFGLTALMQLISGRTDIFVLGMFRADEDVGIYRVASQIGSLVVFGMQVVNAIQGPHIAHLFAKGEMLRLQKMITRSSQAIFLSAFGAVIVIVTLGKFLISTLFGPEFRAAYVPLVIICVGQLVNASIGTVGSLLNMTGHERDTMKSIMVSGSLNVALNLLLTPRLGPIGAAISTTVTLIVWNLIMWQKVRKRIGINSSPFGRIRIRDEK